MAPKILSMCFLTSALVTTFVLQWFQSTQYPSTLWITVTLIAAHSLLSRHRQILIAVILGIIVSFLRIQQTTHLITETSIEQYAEQDIVIEGVIVEEPDRRQLETKYTISTQVVEDENGSHTTEGRILVTDRRIWPTYHYGDRVRVRGTVERPGVIESFSYEHYLSISDVYTVMYFGTIEEVITDHPKGFYGTLFALKERFENQINRLYPEPHASFLAGLLTGSRKGMPEHLLNDFQRTGLTHIIAISGYNITIVITVVSALLLWLPLQWRLVPTAAGIITFTIFVGASAAVVRACIMGIIGLIALHTGRQRHARLTVLWTAASMSLWNPKMLWYDAGFQLSFLAVIGLMELAPLLKRWTNWLPNILGIREAMQMTLAAQITAAPLLIVLFSQLSLIAPIANVLVTPLIPFAMLFGAVGTLVSFVSFPIGQLFAFVGWGCMEWIIVASEQLAKLRFASVPIKSGGALLLSSYYGMLLTLKIYHSYTNTLPPRIAPGTWRTSTGCLSGKTKS